MSAPLVQPRLYDLDATITAAHKLADTVTFIATTDGAQVTLTHGTAVFHATAAASSEALAGAYAELAAYLTDGRS
jgi:hypothetical protein